ncbi:MAG: hypothetical protein HC884_08450 [Chloroflexaceae bacterium]|nr:hypothetical protein [Chloroflexaceae bacterium]
MRRYTVSVSGKTYVIDVEEVEEERFHVQVGNREFDVYLVASEDLVKEPKELKEPATGETTSAAPTPPGQGRTPALHEPEPPVPSSSAAPSHPPPAPSLRRDEGREGAELAAPMPGTIISIEVAPGDTVRYGQVLCILEAMKMKNALQSPCHGVLTEVLVQPGQKVDTGDVLMRFSAQG